MKKIVTINGSPRKAGNTAHLLRAFIQGASEKGADVSEYVTHDLDIRFCSGCLRCNLLKRCSISDDDWPELSDKILESDILVFASPIYFHHVTASLKRVVDRFRSFVHVQITENGLDHTPWLEWKKDFVVILSMGSPDSAEAKPVVDLFQFICSILGPQNRLHVLSGTRLAVLKQVDMDRDALERLYRKLNIHGDLAIDDYHRNQELLERCYHLGFELS